MMRRRRKRESDGVFPYNGKHYTRVSFDGLLILVMHRAFQRDAFRMKLDTARTLVHVLNTKQSPIQECVKLSAEVLGLGPSFVVRIGVMNIGPKSGPGSAGISDLALFFHWNDKFYDVSPPIIHVCCIHVLLLILCTWVAHCAIIIFHISCCWQQVRRGK